MIIDQSDLQYGLNTNTPSQAILEMKIEETLRVF